MFFEVDYTADLKAINKPELSSTVTMIRLSAITQSS